MPNPWRHAVIVAAARGYGAAWVSVVQQGEMVLRLVKDDVPVKGRVRDLQGRPVAGATVGVKNIDRLFACVWAGLPEKVTTGKDGRFTVTGIGRGRSAALRITGPTIQMLQAGINTSTVAGATLDLVAGPTKPIEGVVRARDTGKPLPGVVIYGKHTAFRDWNADPFGEVKAVTDDQGRYRLLGLPKSGTYEVRVYPRAGQSYLQMVKRVGDTVGLEPIPLDFRLRRGVTVRFRLLDKVTRQPVAALAQYTPATGNPLWREAIAPDSNLILPRFFMDCHVPDKDGFFQFVVYPGHGAIFVNAGDRNRYLGGRLDPADEKKGYYPLSKGEPNNGFVGSTAYRVVDTDKTDKPLTFDLEAVPRPSAPERGK
jgi:hypothetical protein